MTTATKETSLLSRCQASGLLGVIVFILSFALTPSAQAQFTYSDFSDVSNLALNGVAVQSDTKLRLTPAIRSSGFAGSAWFATPQPVTNGFETIFTFQITGSNGPYCDTSGGGDGLTFTIQNNDTTALGGIGGFLGYHGILNSVAVEFDTCFNTWDPVDLSNRNHNHIGINLGSVVSAITFTPSDDINSGDEDEYTVRIVYHSDTLDVYFKNLDDPPVLSYSVNLLSELGGETAYVGFTSGVAASYGNHDVLSWSFTPNPDSDGDGVPDDQDICPGGDDGVDTDGDFVPDFCDPCPNDANNDADGDGVCGDVDVCPDGDDNVDTDFDGLPDACDVCPNDPNNDADGDGVCADNDNCPLDANSNQLDTDGDQIGDVCDPDDDADSICDAATAGFGCTAGPDNCPLIYNPDQTDFDSDGIGDICDDDSDNDGIIGANDSCPFTLTGQVVNGDGCSVNDLCPCEGGWKNHGAYVQCVAQTSEDFLAAGLITAVEKDTIVSTAAHSSCGKKK